MNNLLAEIVAHKRKEVEHIKETLLLHKIHKQLSESDIIDFPAALSDRNKINVIAEIKKASPSKGILKNDFDPVALAVKYKAGGAAALSVLTDEKYFHGSAENMDLAKQASGLPVLCKDFIIDAFQIFYARLMKADAVLLIVKLLDKEKLKSMLKQVSELKMAALVEVHDEDETSIALDSGATIIGINNRNLDDFSVSLEVSEKLSSLVPKDVIKVAESGIFNSQDIRRLKNVGYNNFLIGEALMTSENPVQLLKELQIV